MKTGDKVLIKTDSEEAVFLFERDNEVFVCNKLSYKHDFMIIAKSYVKDNVVAL